MRDFQRYLKGQIWHVDKGASSASYGSVEDKSRPFLIVSGDDGNATNDVLQMVPITSQPRPKMPTNVEFAMPERGRNTIICNQVTAISTSQIDYYMGSIAMGVMREVERSICYSLDMRSGKTSLKDIEALIDELYVQHANELEKEKCILSVDQVIAGIKQKLSTLDYDAVTEDSTYEETEVAKETEEIKEEPPQRSTVVEPKKKGSNLKKKENVISTKGQRKKDGSMVAKGGGPGQIYWDEEKMLEYLVDYDTMSKSNMLGLLEKWQLGKKSTALNYMYTFRKKLNLTAGKTKKAAEKPQAEPKQTGEPGNDSKTINFEIER